MRNPNTKSKFKRRPPRLALIFQLAPLYFVTFCTHRRKPWLACDAVHDAFVHFANAADSEFNVAVGRYVIMPEHIHLFVCGDAGFVLGAWIGKLKQALARSAKLSRTSEQIWEEGFFDHVLRSDESYGRKWNYVRENPVRAGLVRAADDWPCQGEIVYIDRA